MRGAIRFLTQTLLLVVVVERVTLEPHKRGLVALAVVAGIMWLLRLLEEAVEVVLEQ
jgi:hypothetical protein